MRQGAGGAYFQGVRQFIQRFHISIAKLLLKLEKDINDLPDADSCSYKMGERECETFDNLEELESSITDDTKQALECICDSKGQRPGRAGNQVLL